MKKQWRFFIVQTMVVMGWIQQVVLMQEVIRFCLLLSHTAFQGFLEKAKQRHFSKETGQWEEKGYLIHELSEGGG